MNLKISANIRDLIPSIVEVSGFVDGAGLLNKPVVFDDKGVYNKIRNIVSYYEIKQSDKNCCKKYNEFKELVPMLNDLLSKYRIALMTVSFGNNNPHMLAPFKLDKI